MRRLLWELNPNTWAITPLFHLVISHVAGFLEIPERCGKIMKLNGGFSRSRIGGR